MPVYVKSESLPREPRVSVESLERAALAVLSFCGRGDAELSILLVNDMRMAELNLEYRGKSGPTNVLSFSLTEGADTAMAGNMLGDVVISVETAAREAVRNGTSFHHHLRVLLVHGVLHLLGYDHERSEDDAVTMAAREKVLMEHLKQYRRRSMIRLAINVDHVATIRQARGGVEPDPVLAAGICELAGAEGIVVHLREDRRHIQDRDLRVLRETVKTKLNLEMGATKEIIEIALSVRPDMVTLVPEKRQELTTEGGLNVAGQKKKLQAVIARMSAAGIPVSLFVDPDPRQIRASLDVGATFVEIHTGRYSDAVSDEERDREFDLVAVAAEEAYGAGLRVNAGHGLNYVNTSRVAALGTIEELSIGHAVMARAIFVGLDQAVREMLALMV